MGRHAGLPLLFSLCLSFPNKHAVFVLEVILSKRLQWSSLGAKWER